MGGAWLDTSPLQCGLEQNVGDRLGCGRNQKLQKGLLHSCFFVLTCEFSCFQIHLLLAEFPQWVLIYFLQCYAPARLTRVIAQQMKSHRDVPLVATFLSVFNCHETVIDCFRDFDCLSLSLSQVLGLPRSTTASLKLRMASTMLFNMSCTSFG